jgi:hypothetical protein
LTLFATRRHCRVTEKQKLTTTQCREVTGGRHGEETKNKQRRIDMKNTLMSKLKGLGKSLLQALASGLVAWLATITSGCTTFVVPMDESNVPVVSMPGVVPISVQLNSKPSNNQ